jgi:ATP-dependent DNA helicase RecG
MNLKELKAIVGKGESERTEFKRSTGQRTEAAKTVCALANGLGGFVFFGITDKGEVVGQQVATSTLEDVANELRRIEPPIFPDVEAVALKGGNSVIAMGVPGGGGPYTYDGRPYLRHGPTTRVMPRAVYEQRVMEKLHTTSRWENQPVPSGVTFADLDEEEIQLTVDNAVDLGRLEPLKRRTTKAILTGLGLVVEGRLLNAAVALYGKSQRLQSLFPQCSIRLARFRGADRLGDFIDNRQYWGHAFALLRRAETFLRDHVPIAGRVVSGRMKREDRPLYPPRATRELVANALCHRDYTIPGGAVSVAMYDDHLEIINTGMLHFDITKARHRVIRHVGENGEYPTGSCLWQLGNLSPDSRYSWTLFNATNRLGDPWGCKVVSPYGRGGPLVTIVKQLVVKGLIHGADIPVACDGLSNGIPGNGAVNLVRNFRTLLPVAVICL